MQGWQAEEEFAPVALLYVAAEHGEHAVVEAEYVPATQGLHAAAAVVGEMAPGGHGVAVVEPSGQ